MIVFKLDLYALLQMLQVKLTISESERYTFQELLKTAHLKKNHLLVNINDVVLINHPF